MQVSILKFDIVGSSVKLQMMFVIVVYVVFFMKLMIVCIELGCVENSVFIIVVIVMNLLFVGYVVKIQIVDVVSIVMNVWMLL